jgi:hypothetical protein
MRTKARDGFIKALRDARRWLDELQSDPSQTIESLAVREGKSERSIRMTISLGFISPVLAKAAMEGRLPRGFSVKRLVDLPMLWSEQWDCRRRFRFEPNSADPSRSFLRAAYLRVVVGKRPASAPASRSRGPGNGILRAETGGGFRAQNAGERSEFGSQTATRLPNRPELRGFPPTRKPRRFAGTARWAMQGSN